jgi:PPM family protein phosphatase
MPRPPDVGAGALGRIQYAWVCRAGLSRRTNEDDLGVRELGPDRLLVVVADGMGGHENGEQASRVAVEAVSACRGLAGPLDVSAYDALLSAILAADEALGGLAVGLTRNPGCTIVAAVVDGGGPMLHLHAGDCRLYHFRAGEPLYRTSDHSVAEIAFREGRIAEDAMPGYAGAGMVLSCLGGDRTAQPEVEPRWLDGAGEADQPALRTLEPGDVLLLCSDGLSGIVPRPEVLEVARASGQDPRMFVDALEARVLAHGAPDNYTALAIRLGAD